MRMLTILFLTVCISMRVCAHADQHIDSSLPPSPHGGQTRMAGPYYFELVSGKGEIAIYVTDHAGQPVDTAGGKGKAVIHTDGRAVTIEVHPAAHNVLKGQGRYQLKRSSVVYVTVDLAHAPPHRAVFRPLESATPRASTAGHR